MSASATLDPSRAHAHRGPFYHAQGAAVYAVVKSGGKQHKVAVGDELVVEQGIGAVGDTITLPALLLVDGSEVTSDPAALADVRVQAEIVRPTKGPKIDILVYRNKTGYRRRMGHRQKLTLIKVTGIDSGKA